MCKNKIQLKYNFAGIVILDITIHICKTFSWITIDVHINLHLTVKLVIQIFSSLYLFCQLNGANIFAYSVVVFEIAAYKLYFQYVPEVIGEIYV